MKIVSLIDNQKLPQPEDLRAEHGLSLCIYTNDGPILFDSGISGAFLSNAGRLNVDISQVTLAVLSHHHYDHGGGLLTFLDANGQAKVYLRSSSTEEFYSHLFGGIIKRRIGLDESLFQHYARRFVFTDEFSEIASNVYIITRIGQRNPFPAGNRYLFVHTEGGARLDDFTHELILVVRENGGLVVFTGCSHRGILNMLDAVQEHFPGQPIRAVFGGFHLIGNPLFKSMGGSKKDIEGLGSALFQYPVERFYTGHCTGAKAYPILKGVMGAKLEYFATGSQVAV
jgi:7,8-dihydropterin-6-yl-methyl-4-(beta-D-ribofuranosyl)aminobenzene 5'-phosphate synthase